MSESEGNANPESPPKTEDKETKNEVNARPGYTYSASFDKQSDQTVRVRLEIDGTVHVVPVCAICHKVNRICCVDPKFTEKQINSAKYLGLDDSSNEKKSDSKDKDSTSKVSPKDSSKEKDGKDTNSGKDSASKTSSKDSSGDGKDSASKTSSKDSSKDSEGSTSGADSGKSSKSSDEKKKKKSDGSDHRKKELPATSWTTHKPSYDDWNKKKKKDF